MLNSILYTPKWGLPLRGQNNNDVKMVGLLLGVYKSYYYVCDW